MRRLALLACLAASVSDLALAIDPSRLMSQYIRDRWGPEQGFPRGAVYAITQTNDGYLWFGVEDGLVRFDGSNFVLIRDESGLLNINNVVGLMADKDGALWFRMEGSNLYRYRDGAFGYSGQDAIAGRFITAMARTTQGNLLVAQMQQGALSFRHDSSQLVADASALPRTPVLAIAQTPNGDIWMGTRDVGLFRTSGKQVSTVNEGLPDPKVNCLLPDGKVDLWVGTDNGIVRWDGKQLTSAGIPASRNPYQVLAMVKDRDANIWVGTDNRGLLRLNAQGIASFDDRGNRAADAITAVFEDREGNIWTGSAKGIERLRDSEFVTYSLPEGLPTDGSNPVLVDSQNRTWFSPSAGGLWWLNNGRHEHVTAAGLEHDVVYSIAGGKEELWLGRQRGGLTQLRFENATFTTKTYTQSDGLAQNSVFSVHQSRDGVVWAGTLSGGVSRFQNGKFTTFKSESGLAANTVSSIMEDREGTMWFATPGGLSALSKGQWRTYTAKDGLPSENVNCLFLDSQGRLWAGTAAGLAYLDSHRFQVPDGLPPPLHEQILGIAEDQHGSLWMATSNHVMRVNRDRLAQSALGDGDFREYGLADGLRGVQGVKRDRSVVSDRLGRIWFSMNRGISVVDPARLASISAPAIVHVQTIASDGTGINLHGAVHIPPLPQRVTFGYAGLSLSLPERVRFRYTLDGFDHGWSKPVAAREAVYTNLGPGPYRFHVMASNPDGVWNSTEAVMTFEIEPAFWQTWWFRVCCAVACVLAILAVYRYRLHQLTHQLSLRFEERLDERTRIAQELHDTLLQGFLSASMQLHVTVDNIPEDSPSKPPLSRILLLMGRVIEEGRNAVKGLRSTSTGLLNLEQAFSRVQQESGNLADADFRIVVEGVARPLNPILRDEAYRIGREALVNAFRHSHAKSIELEIEYAPKYLRILVRDNGCGIDDQVLQTGREGHWGLPGMRERAERIGARLHVWSGMKSGTEVELYVPGSIAYQGQPSDGVLRRLLKRRPPGTVKTEENGRKNERSDSHQSTRRG